MEKKSGAIAPNFGGVLIVVGRFGARDLTCGKSRGGILRLRLEDIEVLNSVIKVGLYSKLPRKAGRHVRL